MRRRASLEEGPQSVIPLPHYLIGLSQLDCLELVVDVFAWWTCLVGKMKGCIRGDTLPYRKASNHDARGTTVTH